LRSLKLDRTRATDAGLRQVARLKQLQALGLGGTQVTDAGIIELAGLKDLQELGLGGTGLTDTGLQALEGLKQLRSLDLGFTQVTDAGLRQLAVLKQLMTPYVGNTKVTDAGLKELDRLKRLSENTRKWSDKTGRFSFDGEFVRIEGDTVHLKCGDAGKAIRLEHLSDADRRFIETLQSNAKRARTNNVPPIGRSSADAFLDGLGIRENAVIKITTKQGFRSKSFKGNL
jgi:hypothetical protein